MNSLPEIIIPENPHQLQVLQLTGDYFRARITATDADPEDELKFNWYVPPLVDFKSGENYTGAIATSYLDFPRDQLEDGERIDCFVSDGTDRVYIQWQVEKE
ncbi:MAG: hypothetical protein HN348_16195 [Proteobacteria bacterium]|nr:hypothetical protein [Pseudomonadota bacterium]